MLVFKRRRAEAVIIGSRHHADPIVKVTVLAINGLHVKLGFEAADHIAVHREEVWARICHENVAASAGPAAEVQTTNGWDDDGGK
jgi:carbon storage regulator CsrA